MTNPMRRRTAFFASAAAIALVLSACGGGGEEKPGGNGDGGDVDCSLYEAYGKFEGAKVEMLSSIREVEADQLEESWADFEKCTGIDVTHTGIGDFETQIRVQAEGGNVPDIAIFPQPGLLENMVKGGYVKAAPESVEKNADEGWSPEWKEYGTIDGTFYAAPLMASVKSFVWYSPTMFKDGGYEVPKTLDEMMALTAKIAENNTDTSRPWCAGIESGGATGWPATDWVEDYMLRYHGPEAYQDWVDGKLAFNDPKVVEVVDAIGEILKNDDYVNGGYGDSRSIATTSFGDGGFPILEGNCYMYRMASFYEAQWPRAKDDVKVAEDGDVFAFALPGKTAGEVPLLVGGEFVGAFNDKPEVQAFQTYLSSGDWAKKRVEIGGVTSANKAVDPSTAGSPILRLAIELLQDPNTVVAFDGSDMMPSEVGAGSFWSGMTDWINGSDTKTVLDAIYNSWPKN